MAKQPGEIDPTKAPPGAAATHSDAEALLVAGAIYTGTVVSRADDGSYSVSLDSPRITVSGVLLASSVVGGMMGFNIRTRLGPGTLVELAWGKTPFVHAVIPPNNKDWLNGKNRSLLWDPAPKDGYGDNFSETPSDLLDGEFEISNLFGVAMQFLTTLISMGAGDRARVECCLINDMVRVISSQYRHFSGIGDELIFDHGRPTMERHWGSYRHELLGKLKLGAELAALKGDAIDKDSISEERVTAVGRYRLIEFIGFAGDFIHSFVADPPATLVNMASELAGEATPAGAGKSWVHRNSDGSVLVQSVADIRLERVTRIPVPYRKISHEDPKLTVARDYTTLATEYDRLISFGDTERKSAYRLAYQIRMYSRWLARLHACSRLLQLGDEYGIQTESESPTPSWTNHEADRDRANADVQYYDAYACVTILRDGSVVLHDGYGSSVVMSNGNLQLSAARHLDMEAAGDIRMVCGGSLLVKALRSIDMTAERGGISFYSHAWFKAFCAAGSVWLRSAADVLTTPVAKADGPVPLVAGHDAGKPCAVLVESTRGNAVVRTDSGIGLFIDGRPPLDTHDAPTHNLEVHTKGNIRLHGRHFLIAAGRDLLVSAKRAMALSVPRLYGKIVEMDLTGMFLSNGRLAVEALTAKVVSANSAQVLKKLPMRDPSSPSAKASEPHLNHVDVLQKAITTLPHGMDAAAEAARSFTNSASIHVSNNPWSSASVGPVWEFSPPTEYHWDKRDEERGSLVESLTQQYLRLDVTDGDMWHGAGYDTWTWAANALPGPRVGKAGGFGTNCRVYACNSGYNLHTPSPRPLEDMTGDTSPGWSVTAPSMKTLKRQ